MSTWRKCTGKVLVDTEETDVTSSASKAVIGERVTADGTSPISNWIFTMRASSGPQQKTWRQK